MNSVSLYNPSRDFHSFFGVTRKKNRHVVKTRSNRTRERQKRHKFLSITKKKFLVIYIQFTKHFRKWYGAGKITILIFMTRAGKSCPVINTLMRLRRDYFESRSTSQDRLCDSLLTG